MLHPNGVVVFALGQAVDMFPYPLFSCLGKTVCFLSLSTLGQIWAFLQCSVKHEITQSVSRDKMQCLFSATQPSASERAPNWENQYLGDWPFGYSAIFSSYHPPSPCEAERSLEWKSNIRGENVVPAAFHSFRTKTEFLYLKTSEASQENWKYIFYYSTFATGVI